MFTGRRPRSRASVNVVGAETINPGGQGVGIATTSQVRSLNIMTQSNADDHCYASPKRKENKVDPTKNLILKTVLAKEINTENRRTNMNLRRNRAISSYFATGTASAISVSNSTSVTHKHSPSKTNVNNVIDPPVMIPRHS